jgi:hypothetical protein
LCNKKIGSYINLKALGLIWQAKKANLGKLGLLKI